MRKDSRAAKEQNLKSNTLPSRSSDRSLVTACSRDLVDRRLELGGRKSHETSSHRHDSERATNNGEARSHEIVPSSPTLGDHHLDWRDVVGELGLRNLLARYGVDTPLVRLLVTPETCRLKPSMDHLEEMVRSMVELVNYKGPPVQRVDVPFVLSWQVSD